MSLSKQVIELESIPSDVPYMLYLNFVKYIDDYNIFDIS